jgi:hypothetical protein
VLGGNDDLDRLLRNFHDRWSLGQDFAVDGDRQPRLGVDEETLATKLLRAGLAGRQLEELGEPIPAAARML